jgi:hypothetical protein
MITSTFSPRESAAPPPPAPCPLPVLGRFARWVLLGSALVAGHAGPLLAQAPANDSFAGQSVLTGSTNRVHSSNVAATGEVGEPSHAGNPASASVWWTWVAPDTGLAIVDTQGSPIDTVLAVYTGDAVGALNLIVANDDAPGLSTSRVGFPAIRGTPYRIAVDGYLGASGDVHLGLYLLVAPSAPTITGQPASQTVPDQTGSNVTFSVTATGSFPLVFDWQKDGVSLPGGTNESYTVTNVTLAAAGGYRVVVANDSGSSLSSVAVLTVLATLEHDVFADRAILIGATNTATGHNFGATREAGEPVHAGVPSGASLWWSWTASRNGLVQLDTAGSLTEDGTGLDTVLAVYVGDSLSSLTPVAANHDELPGQVSSSKVFFRAAAGVTYQFAVAGLQEPNGTVAVGAISLQLAQAPDNDFFAQALTFPEGLTQVHDHNAGATTEADEPRHASNPGGKSVWWTWVAPSTGTYVLDTVGSAIDTVLAVYTGSAMTSLTVVGEDDNRSAAGASLVKFQAVGGTTYRFAVDGYAGPLGVSEGEIVLNLNPSLWLNDAFAERVTLSRQTNRVTELNLDSSKEPGEPNHGGNAGGRSIWWTWTARVTGPVLVTTRGSTFDTVLAVYTGTELASLQLIAEDDDSDFMGALARSGALFSGESGEVYQSQLALLTSLAKRFDSAPTNATAGSWVLFPGVAGQTYQIAVDGYRADDQTVAAGTVLLNLVQPTVPAPGANDVFENRFAITGQTNLVFGVNLNATLEVGEPNHAGNDGGRSVWWSWVAPATAPVQLNTALSGFDTLLGVYEGSRVDHLTRVAADWGSAGGGRSIVTFEAVEGVEYQIAVDGFNNGTGAASGRVALGLRQFPAGALHANDAFEHASPIADPFLTVVGSNIGASRQPAEPAHAAVSQGHSVWWTWTAAADGAVTVSTAGSQFDTLLSVYTGDSVEALSRVTENDDLAPGQLQSQVRFQAIAGTGYRIAVDGYANQIGLITLTVSPAEITPSAPHILQAPVDQTRFAGGTGGGSNVVFQVVATGTPPLAYQWLLNGVPVPGSTGDALTVTNAGVHDSGTYQVVVSNLFGVSTSAGAELAVFEAPFNDDFAHRFAVAGTSKVVRGSIFGASKQPNEPHHGGELGGRSVWWSWTAPTNGPVEIHTLGSSFDTLLGVYTGSAPDSLTLIAENDQLVMDSSYASRVLFSAVAGQEYQIAVDAPKTNHEGNVVLTITQPPPPPVIAVPPQSVNSVEVTNRAFTLEVQVAGVAPLVTYQWFFNGNPLAHATNATHVFGALSRANSGRYSVAITNDFGHVVSSEALVWVRVPQQLRALERTPDGRGQFLFSDPDGVLSSEPSRFEVQHTADLSGATTVWVVTPGTISLSNGQFLFEEQTAGTNDFRYYRVIEP